MNARALRLPSRWSAEQRFVLGAVCFLVCTTPAFIHYQLVTGTVINAALLVCAAVAGGPVGAAFGLLPSLVAVTSGTLPWPLLPLVPFIAASNVLLVVVFAALHRNDPLVAMLLAAFLKFAFLCLIASTVAPLLTPTMPVAAALILSWPQLATALAGGGIALAVLSRQGGKP
jgi:hypothetical protein